MPKANFTIRQLFEMDACTNCRLCADVCPAACAAVNGELSAVYRMKGLKRKLKSKAGLFSKLLGRRPPSAEELKHYADTVFRCTLCSNCEEVCPLGIRLKELWLSLREDLVQEKAYPSKIDMIRTNLAKSRNVFGEDNAERGEWVEDMRKPPADRYVRPRAEVVYVTGCVSAYFPLAQKIPIALVEIMDAGGVDFTLLGEEEWCCGFPLLGAGLMEMFEDFRAQNLAAVKAKGAATVVFACPSCYQMWREHYRTDLELLSAPEFLLRTGARGEDSAHGTRADGHLSRSLRSGARGARLRGAAGGDPRHPRRHARRAAAQPGKLHVLRRRRQPRDGGSGSCSEDCQGQDRRGFGDRRPGGGHLLSAVRAHDDELRQAQQDPARGDGYRAAGAARLEESVIPECSAGDFSTPRP